MKTTAFRVGFLGVIVAAMLVWGASSSASTPPVGKEVGRADSPASPPNPIPIDQLGAVAGKQYPGDGLSVVATDGGAQLRCVFQRMEGEVSRDGLWLKSTVPAQTNDRFQVKAMAVGEQTLPCLGVVSTDDQTVRFSRPGLVEEYSVSMDGVRQDFVVLEKPLGVTGLHVELEVEGAKVEQTATGAQLVLEKSGRKIAYSRLKVTDANGKELPARFEVASNSPLRTPRSEFAMAVVVDDAEAAYPIRIDPTFSDANWVSMGGISGANSIVYAAVLDGSGNLYIGGYFTMVGNVIASRIAKWNGSSWSALGSGMDGGVSALAVSGNDVYAGGSFTSAGGVVANYVAKWNGSSWSAMESGLNGGVSALAVSGNDVYVGGDFTSAGGVAANYVAKWNGSSWSAMGSGMDGGVSALAVSGTNVYAGGFFTIAGGAAAKYIAKWNSTSWSPLGSGMSGVVSALAVSGNDVYVGGEFLSAGGVLAKNVAKWSGSSWSALGLGLDGRVYALAVSGSDLYAGGDLYAANYVARWNGSSWSGVGAGMNHFVYALAASGSNVFVGGRFSTAGGVAAGYIAKWNGSSWSAPGSGSGPNNEVYALAVAGADLYAAGSFNLAGEVPANYIAKWNGSAWSALGSGMSAPVFALAVSGSNVYAGGLFSSAGGVPAHHVAKWDGSSWSALGYYGLSGGLAPNVYALAVDGTNLYAGGRFTTADFVTEARYIAKWNGSSWSALGSVVAAPVHALVVLGSNVYAGGGFNEGIAKWNGSSWSSLGLGLNGWVSALALSGSNIYVGGGFTSAGGVAANYVAKWNGSSWSAVGSGMNNSVYALAVSGNELYAGGNFTTAGGNVANRIAKWDGSNWSALGSGVDNSVAALAVSGSDIYVGGMFTMAGGKVSAYMARAIPPGDPPQFTDQPDSVTVSSTATAGFRIVVIGTAPLTYQWRKNGASLSNLGNIAGATSTNLIVSNVQPSDAGQYSVVVFNAYGSVTSSVAVLGVSVPGEMVTLGDYFPLPLNANWLYDGTDWDGAPAKTRNHVSSVNTNITLYTGRSPAVAYTTNCIQLAAAYLDRTTMVAYDTWEEYFAIGGRFGQFGDDDLPNESLRVDGGVVFPAQMAVGGSATNVADGYLFGAFAGMMTNALQVLERTSLTVPAGYFPDVLHMRQTIGFPGGTQVQDQWWARSVGKIKRQGISGGGAAHHFELISYSVPIPPGILVNDGSMGFVSNVFGFNITGQSGQAVAVEVSTNLLNWLPLQTNTFGTGPFYFSDPNSQNLPRRFYRLRSL